MTSVSRAAFGLHRGVGVWSAATLALFALVGLIAKGVEKL